MRFAAFLLLLGALPAWAGDAPTALDAVKLLPKDRATHLAGIEARDGTPNPERWYLLVQDPADENGLHEFVVANNQIVASRALSQFAEKLQPADIIGSSVVNVDSDHMVLLARAYAAANNATISKLNFELKKDGPEATPVWRVSCLGENDLPVGELTVNAIKGHVISHEGFAQAPAAAAERKKSGAKSSSIPAAKAAPSVAHGLRRLWPF